MSDKYKHDAFISFSHMDVDNVRPIYQTLTDYGLNVFWSEENLTLGKAFPPDLKEALKGSQNLILYFTKNASGSKWVNIECNEFFSNCQSKDSENRRMYVLSDGSCDLENIPLCFNQLNRPKSVDQLITGLVTHILKSKEEINAKLLERLNQEKRKVEEARDYYRHARFWRPIAENKDIHIFTCARDIPQDRIDNRGQGCRTNIDKWDYRAVLDITNFFASNYPNTRVTIEDPISKLQGVDLTNGVLLADHINSMEKMLEDKDCIIIGSPDVSDFAEIVLAKIHRIHSYTECRKKNKGFVIIREQKNTLSSFSWEKDNNEREGIAQIFSENNQNRYEYFPHIINGLNDRGPHKMFGILIVANNPYCKENKQRKKIIIMSGASGVATNAIAKLLTDESCLKEFFKLDQAYVNTDRNIEALIGVEYVVEDNPNKRDARKIANSENAITFERLVEI